MRRIIPTSRATEPSRLPGGHRNPHPLGGARTTPWRAQPTTDEQIAVLLIAAPVFGLLSGVTAVLTPIVTRTYFDKTSIAASMS